MSTFFDRDRKLNIANGKATRSTPRGNFRSKIEGMQMRIPVWHCLACDRTATIEQKKAMYCINCGARGHYFPSSGEFRAYAHRNMLRNAGYITNLILQPAFPIIINGLRVCTYRADFQYDVLQVRGDYESIGKRCIEDFKGSVNHTSDSSDLRRKLAQAMYGITVTLVES